VEEVSLQTQLFATVSEPQVTARERAGEADRVYLGDNLEVEGGQKSIRVQPARLKTWRSERCKKAADQEIEERKHSPR
jgi:hypothetical protein